MNTVDSFGLVQQVQGVVEAYVRGRAEKAALEEKIFQLNQDNARLQKSVKELLTKVDALSNTKVAANG